MRQITSHELNDVNNQIRVSVQDEKGPGGAHHHYEIKLPDGSLTPILFQKGGIVEVGINGVTQEALLAIVIDRLQCINDVVSPAMAFENNVCSNPYSAFSLAFLKFSQKFSSCSIHRYRVAVSTPVNVAHCSTGAPSAL